MNTAQNSFPRVQLKDSVFWIHGSYVYPIDEARITNERDLLAWAHHLSRKTWADRKLIGDFIEVVANAKGFNLKIRK